ncbi:MAG: cytochrome c oxidase accessory protein CcoG [Leptospiraceae bacterium]|nr:cytochrome c oxidase accessory protein CcoG [Leptospiraceae bacterium]
MVIARPIEGKHRTIKNRINIALFALFLVLPFIRINGHPFLLLDIPQRTFHVFGLTIWPQELYFLHVILLTLGFMLLFFTALFGRIWCGYACPQTIFTEAYNWVGKLVSGNSYGKPTMKKSHWARVIPAWVLLSFLFSFVFVAYFVRYEFMLGQLAAGNIFAFEDSYRPAAWFIFLMASTGTAFFNMVYFRENLCKYACPYGRFQAALIDRHSPIVMYDVERGEQRRQKGQKVGEHAGDCIDCHLCVQVCPTGIDIRDGLQIGCLSCGLCVDACNSVLQKFDKPTLIEYSTIAESESHQVDRKSRPYFRPRTAVYGAVVGALMVVFTMLLVLRTPIYASIQRDAELRNRKVADSYQNGYELHLGNMSYTGLRVNVAVKGDGPFEIISRPGTIELDPSQHKELRLIVAYNAEKAPLRPREIQFIITSAEDPTMQQVVESKFTFPIE